MGKVQVDAKVRIRLGSMEERFLRQRSEVSIKSKNMKTVLCRLMEVELRFLNAEVIPPVVSLCS